MLLSIVRLMSDDVRFRTKSTDRNEDALISSVLAAVVVDLLCGKFIIIYHSLQTLQLTATTTAEKNVNRN